MSESKDLSQMTEEILRKFEQTWTFDIQDLQKPSADAVLRELIAPYSEAGRLSEEFFAQGPLSPLLDNESINEIVINGANEIWLENGGRFEKFSDQFFTETTFKNFIDRLCMEAQIKVDLAQPFANGHWRGFRVHLACAPLTHCSFHLTLRRTAANPWTLDKLQSANWCTADQADLLRRLVREHRNVLVIGATGSGKTTVLGACLKEIAANERSVIMEDTEELHLPNSASTKLLTRPASAQLPEVNLTELVRQSLRMRPMRLVVGEVRGAEAKDLLLALATGHSGSWGTLHASEARQALLRLEMLIQMGAPQWSLQAIRQLLHLSVDALVVCANEDGHRHLGGVFKVAALESFGFLLEPMEARGS